MIREWLWEKALPVAVLLVACVIVGVAAGARAHANPADDYASSFAGAVCATLDDHPTMAGLVGVLQGVEDTGHLSPTQAGEAVALSVAYICPNHQALLRRFVDAYGRGIARSMTVTA